MDIQLRAGGFLPPGLVDEGIVQDAKQLGRQLLAAVEAGGTGDRTFGGDLHQILGLIELAGQRDGKAAKIG